MPQVPTSGPDKEVPITEQLERTGQEYDIYREDDETDAEYCDRIITALDEMVNELLDVQAELSSLYPQCE